VTDPFDTVRAGLVVGRSFGDAEAYRALASIEERLKRVETAFDSLTANYEDERARAEAAERERDALQHIIDCADTPLMRDVLRERDDLRQKRDSVGTLAVEEAIGRSKAEIRIAELEEALLPFAEAANDKLPVDSVLNARRALATSEQAAQDDEADLGKR
jgi:hypothetical protein